MAIENEYKFAITGWKALEDKLSSSGVAVRSDLRQCYLGPETRIREEALDGKMSYVLAFKRRMTDGRNIEIEGQASAEDFAALWPTGLDKVCKRRWSFTDSGVQWDVDFFCDPETGCTTIAIAEAEMSGDDDKCPEPHALLDGHVSFAVSRDDNRFFSRSLASSKTARGVAAQFNLRP